MISSKRGSKAQEEELGSLGSSCVASVNFGFFLFFYFHLIHLQAL
jgi:hypothetical protein